jgi:hypothetical protein
VPARDFADANTPTQAQSPGMANPPPSPGTRTTSSDPAIRSGARLMLQVLPFAIIASIGVSGW